MRKLAFLFTFYILVGACKQNTVDTVDVFSKIEGTYNIGTVLTDGKSIMQTNATLIISRISSSSNTANFKVTYTLDSGKIVTDELQAKIEETKEGYVLFYDPNHYPTSRFAIWNSNVVNCNPLTGQGPNIGFSAKR